MGLTRKLIAETTLSGIPAKLCYWIFKTSYPKSLFASASGQIKNRRRSCMDTDICCRNFRFKTSSKSCELFRRHAKKRGHLNSGKTSKNSTNSWLTATLEVTQTVMITFRKNLSVCSRVGKNHSSRETYCLLLLWGAVASNMSNLNLLLRVLWKVYTKLPRSWS